MGERSRRPVLLLLVAEATPRSLGSDMGVILSGRVAPVLASWPLRCANPKLDVQIGTHSVRFLCQAGLFLAGLFRRRTRADALKLPAGFSLAKGTAPEPRTEIGSTWVVDLHRGPLTWSECAIKRAFDIVWRWSCWRRPC